MLCMFYHNLKKMRCHTGETQIEGHSIKYQSSAPQNCQELQRQGTCEKLLQTRGGWGDTKNKCNVGSWDETRMLWGGDEVQMKCQGS